MKKRVLSVLMALVLCTCISLLSATEVYAENEYDVDDYSQLTDELESEVTEYNDGDGLIIPYGTYLRSGTSIINNKGNGKIGAGGYTLGNKIVPSVKISVMVQRYTGSSWASYTSWSASASNASSITSSKVLSVTKGYYYRVKCIHSAGGEGLTSYTNGIYIN